MRVWYDGVIWSRQQLGGVNRYFSRIIDGLPGDVSPVLTVERRREVNFPASERLEVIEVTRGGAGRVRRVPCDVFHPTYFETLSGADVMDAGAPVALTVHDALHELHPELADPGGEQRAWKRALIPRADHVICVSHNTKKDVMEIFGVPGERITVVHHASDLCADMAPQAPDLACARPYFLYVGHRYCYKNVPGLLRAFAALRSKRPDAMLRFTGAPFSEAEKRQLAELGLLDAARCEGCVPDSRLAALYKNAVGLVYPSLYEGFGIPVLEAMACDCPVVASDTSSIPEVAGDAGLLAAPGDTEAFVHHMLSLLDDPGLRAGLIARGRARAALFTWERAVEATVSVYRALAGRGGRA